MLASLLLLAATAIPVTGQVLDAGQPLAGARIELVPVHGDAPVKSTLSRPDGTFELLAPESGAYRAVVQAKDRPSLEHLVVPLVEEAALPPVDLRYPRGWRPAERPRRPEGKVTRVVTGKVVDAHTGKPIPGALVWSGLPPDLPPVRTGEDGAFRLPLPKPGSPFGVAAAGYLISEVEPSAKPVTVALKKAAQVEGQVVDTEGTPIASAFVQIQPSPFQDRRLSSLRYPSELSSGTDGGFSIRGLLPEGVYKLAASLPGYGQTEIEIRTAPAGKPTPPARLVLGSGAVATGRVMDEKGKPVEGALVQLQQAELYFPDGLLHAGSDRTGAVSIRGLAPGQYRLTVRRPGFAPLTRSPVQVPEGAARLDLGEIVLQAGTTIEGRVIDAAGRPVEGAEIHVSSYEDEIGFFDLEDAEPGLVSGEDGHFRIPGLEPGARYAVSVHHADHPSETVPGVEAPTAEPITVELQASRTLSGRVVGPDGEPVPDAEVTAVVQMGLAAYSGDSMGRTDSAGEFRGTRLKPGSLDLHVRAGGFRDAFWKGIQIPRDRDPDPVTITMERGAILEGRAVDQDGNPVAEARIQIQPRTRPEHWMMRPMLRGMLNSPTTGADGRFRVDDLDPGEYDISAYSPELGRSAEQAVRLGTGTTRVDLVFERGIEVSGRVLNEEGQPIPSASVQLKSTSEGQIQTVSGHSEADGSFRLPTVRAGEHQVTAYARGYAKPEPRKLVVSGSRVDGIEIRLTREAPGGIAGRVLGLSAETLAELRIDANTEDSDDWGDATGRPDHQGRFRLPDLRPGRWIVNAVQPNGLTLTQEAVVEPGAEAYVEFQFPEGLTFAGRLTVDGRPLRGAEIVAASLEARTSFSRTVTDFEGRFSIGPLKPGLHSLIILGAESALTAYRAVHFEEGQEVRLNIETGGLQGRILDSEGEPVPDAAIQLHLVDPTNGNPLPDFGPTVRSDAQGAFELLAIPSGVYALRVQKPGFEDVQAQIEIGPGPPRVQDIRIEPRRE